MLRIVRHLDELAELGVLRCVVLGGRTTAPQSSSAEGRDEADRTPAHWMAARLRSLGMTVDETDDTLMAFARTLLNERLDETRSSWGLRPTGPAALLIADRASCDEFDRLIDALEQFAEATVLCLPQESAPTIHDRDEQDGGSATGTSAPHPFRRTEATRGPSRPSIEQPAASPKLVSAETIDSMTSDEGATNVDRPPHFDEADDDDDDGSLISPAELAMLLGRDERQAPDRADPNEPSTQISKGIRS